MQQHKVWYVYVRCVWRGMPDWQAGIPLQTQRTYTHHTLCCRITTLSVYIFNKF